MRWIDPSRIRDLLYVVAAFVLLAAISLLDAITGADLSFSLFYAVPVAVVAWVRGGSAGVLVALLAAAASLAADVAGHRGISPAADSWNTAARLGIFLLTAIGLTRVRAMLETARRQARQDGLTAVANNRHFFELLDKEAERSRRHDRPLTLAYLDLDGFKQINDLHGHLAGDRVLQEAARAFSSSVRINDVVARLGGDEFAVLLPESSLQEARPALERLQQDFQRSMADNGWSVTVSIGAVTFASPVDDTDEMVRQADEQMYQAKRAGKNRIVMNDSNRPTQEDRPRRVRRWPRDLGAHGGTRL